MRRAGPAIAKIGCCPRGDVLPPAAPFGFALPMLLPEAEGKATRAWMLGFLFHLFDSLILAGSTASTNIWNKSMLERV